MTSLLTSHSLVQYPLLTKYPDACTLVLHSMNILQYKDISEAHELALKELTQSEQSVKCVSEQLISKNWEEISTLTEKLKQANQERQKLQTELEEYQAKGREEIHCFSVCFIQFTESHVHLNIICQNMHDC